MSPTKIKVRWFQKGLGGDQLQCICHWFLVEIHSKLTAFFLLVFLLIVQYLAFVWVVLVGFPIFTAFGRYHYFGKPTKKPGQHRIHQTFHVVPTNGGTHLFSTICEALCPGNKKPPPKQAGKKRAQNLIPAVFGYLKTEVTQPAVTHHGLATNSVF